MKAIAILLGNYDELIQAQQDKERLNLPSADRVTPKIVEMEFYFRLDSLSSCFKAIDGNLKCQIAGMTVVLKNEPKVFKTIKNYLESR